MPSLFLSITCVPMTSFKNLFCRRLTWRSNGMLLAKFMNSTRIGRMTRRLIISGKPEFPILPNQLPLEMGHSMENWPTGDTWPSLIFIQSIFHSNYSEIHHLTPSHVINSLNLVIFYFVSYCFKWAAFKSIHSFY